MTSERPEIGDKARAGIHAPVFMGPGIRRDDSVIAGKSTAAD
jgi:hypothetical protein